MKVKLIILGISIAIISLWTGSYVMSFANNDNSWFIYPTLMTMSTGIIGGIYIVLYAVNA